MAQGDAKHGPTFHVCVRYEAPPVAALTPSAWCLIETHAQEDRARESARLLSSYVVNGGGSVAVVEETGAGAPLRALEVFSGRTAAPKVTAVTPTNLAAREAFAARMTEHWQTVLARRSGDRRTKASAPAPSRSVAALAAAPRRTALMVAGIAVAASIAGIGVWYVVSPRPPSTPPAPVFTLREVEELQFQRGGGFTMIRPNPRPTDSWNGEALFRAYRVHPDGRREFVGLRHEDGSDPEPPPSALPGGPGGGGGAGGGGGGAGGGGGGGSAGGSSRLQAISEGFRRGN